MIITERIINSIDNKELNKTYSDSNKVIRKIGTNEFYEEAIDVLNSNYEYIETEQEIIRESEV